MNQAANRNALASQSTTFFFKNSWKKKQFKYQQKFLTSLNWMLDSMICYEWYDINIISTPVEVGGGARRAEKTLIRSKYLLVGSNEPSPLDQDCFLSPRKCKFWVWIEDKTQKFQNPKTQIQIQLIFKQILANANSKTHAN